MGKFTASPFPTGAPIREMSKQREMSPKRMGECSYSNSSLSSSYILVKE